MRAVASSPPPAAANATYAPRRSAPPAAAPPPRRGPAPGCACACGRTRLAAASSAGRRAGARAGAAAAEPSVESEAWAAAAAGEWDGVTATFGADGAPQELPPYYVPEAYASWGVAVHDWQSQCSSAPCARGVEHTVRRLMPTVGCEADAVAFTEARRRVAAGEPGTRLAAAPDGSYCHGPAALAACGDGRAAVEACLATGAGTRTRVVANLARAGAATEWRLAGVEVHRERRDGPHTGRRELAGCGGGLEPFATGPALEPAAVAGEWRAAGGGAPWRLDAGGGALVGLPAGVWFRAALAGGEAAFAAGVLLEGGARMRAAELRTGAGGGAAVLDLER